MSIRDRALRTTLAGLELTPEEAHSLGIVTYPPGLSLDDSELESECPSIGLGLWPLNACDTIGSAGDRDEDDSRPA